MKKGGSIRLPGSLDLEMRKRFEEAYPIEGCGLLLGRRDEKDETVVTAFEPVDNISPVRREDRYEINPMDYLRIEEAARRKGLQVIGIAHSHPDHPDIPSDVDLDLAWEFFSYLIYTVRKGSVVGRRAWRLVETEDERRFLEEPIRVVSGPP